MRRNYSRRSGILLMEVIMAICFFAIAGAVCMQVLAKTHTISEQTRDLDFAVTQTASIADLLAVEADAGAALTPYYPDLVTDSGRYLLFFNEIGETTGSTGYYYQIIIQPTDRSAPLPAYHISLMKHNAMTPVYELDVTSFQPAAAAGKRGAE